MPAQASNHIPANRDRHHLRRWRQYAYRRGVSTSDEQRTKNRPSNERGSTSLAITGRSHWEDMSGSC